MAKLHVDDIIEVQGFVMMQGLDPGLYRVKDITHTIYPENKVYNLCKPNGNKVLVRHFANSLDGWLKKADNPDLNKIVWIKNKKYASAHPPELRMREIAVLFDDGDYLRTQINGTNQEIQNYYLNQSFEKRDEIKHKCTEVLFLDIYEDVQRLLEVEKKWKSS